MGSNLYQKTEVDTWRPIIKAANIKGQVIRHAIIPYRIG